MSQDIFNELSQASVQPGAGAQKLKSVPKHNSWCGPQGGRRLPRQDIGLCEHGYSILVN